MLEPVSGFPWQSVWLDVFLVRVNTKLVRKTVTLPQTCVDIQGVESSLLLVRAHEIDTNPKQCTICCNLKCEIPAKLPIHHTVASKAGSHNPKIGGNFIISWSNLVDEVVYVQNFLRTYKPRPGEVIDTNPQAAHPLYHRVTMSWIACQSHSWEPHATYRKVCIKPCFRMGIKYQTQLVSLPDFYQQLVVLGYIYYINI